MPTTLRLAAAYPADIARAAELLRRGGTVGFPTETVYGLGANALSPEAVAAVFAAKQRPSWDPLIVHVAALRDALALVTLGDEVRRRVSALADAFWPGPLTLLLPRRPLVPDAVTAGRTLVGVRVPAHPVAQALLHAAALPLAAPSANLFGHTSPTLAQHVLDDLDGRIDAVLDGGETTIGLESTVLDPNTTPMMLYRPGALGATQLEEATGVPVTFFAPEGTAAYGNSGQEDRGQAGLPSPGVGLRHYAPRARLILTAGHEKAVSAALASAPLPHVSLGVLLPEGWYVNSKDVLLQPWARWDDPVGLAARLFLGLRALDARRAKLIVCPLPEPSGAHAGALYDALRDRLEKAARLI